MSCNIILWLQRHKANQFGDKTLVHQFMHQQLILHECCLDQHLQANMLHRLRSVFQDMIFHCEDHMATTLMLYCPMTYAKMMQKTFLQSPSVFKPCEGSPVQFAATIHHTMPTIFRPVIKKMYKRKIVLPKAVILPKGKNVPICKTCDHFP